MPQNEYIEEAIKSEGRRLDYEERKRKREARQPHVRSAQAQKAFGLKAKLLNKKRHTEKVEIRKKIKAHEQKDVKKRVPLAPPDSAIPAYLMDRGMEQRSKVLSNMVKEKRKEKAGKWAVPLPKVKGIAEEEIFKVISSGKRNSKTLKI